MNPVLLFGTSGTSGMVDGPMIADGVAMFQSSDLTWHAVELRTDNGINTEYVNPTEEADPGAMYLGYSILEADDFTKHKVSLELGGTLHTLRVTQEVSVESLSDDLILVAPSGLFYEVTVVLDGPWYTLRVQQPATITTSPDAGILVNDLARWYKSDSYSLSDGDIIGGTGRTWTDQTGGSNAVQATVANRPVFKTAIFGSLPAIRFDPADNSFLTFNSIVLTGAFTVIAIAKCAGSTTFLGHTLANTWIRAHVSSSNLDVYDSVNHPESDVFPTSMNTVRMLSWRRSATGVFSFREQDISRGDVTPGALTGFTINQLGGNLLGGGGNAYLGELCVYIRKLTDMELDDLYNGYFKARWGLT